MKAAAVLTLMVVVTGCAPKTAPLPPAVTSPKFPDFVQPQPPPGLGTPAALERAVVSVGTSPIGGATTSVGRP